ncbi:N-acetylmuramoyl-L-alanine amidase [Bacillus paranthracis]|uniref:N-acetylmuramoyl-L-alanine amidase n=1 Tax=uncultured Caudovirales phage TaxID=2100421 RepID=A0A2H4JAS1_9CAUD|nr:MULTISPECIES: N-acetylmuramoyl-L-alanine amidase [Bacillus cereus group]ASN69606.1 putative N-acetylmuramoyl-L-alanine amidase [uncultured Caudovirales phage]ONG75515.1 N-acetylmuramoyl-L-alanine amidase [Bacillus cereus]MCU5387354.1 N-acetylmuramoyl-L-alanine amidase [Bacillus paranthracis]MDA1824639.1 N-acetylmuramoyl-L-alanine amidase [Bacillus cereus group sp. BY25LC]MDA2192000.1 N-acetylmuramoyl-L-alanine amidase [Bacillus cereus group sp. Bc238]
MKKTLKHISSVLFAVILALSVTTSAFADRTLIIPDLPKQSYRYGVGAYEGVVAHSTATPEAPAINIQKYESRTWRSAFVHYAVDWNETIQIADTKYIAYGAGPGANKRFVHVELCETRDYEKFKRSYDKYVKLLAKILRDRGISVEKGLWTHYDVTKYLGGTDHEDPLDYLKSHGVSEAQFRADVQRAYNNSSVEVSVPDKPSKPAEVPTAVTDGIAYIEGYNVNLRKGPGTSYSKIRQLNKPESYIVWGEKDGWLNLGNKQWIKNDSSYVKFSKKSTVDSSIVGKRVVSKVNNLRFYDTPSWQDKDVAGTVDAGLGFTIDAKVNVNGSSQYKVHNSKGKTYYVTANEAYVYVK